MLKMEMEKFDLVIKEVSIHNQMRHLRKLEMYVVATVEKTQWRCDDYIALHEKFPNLLRKSPYSVQIQENTNHKKLYIWTLFI